MTPKKNIRYTKENHNCCAMKVGLLKLFYLPLILILLNACDSFVEADFPNSQLIGDTVFEDEITAKAAMADIYIKMRENTLVTGTQLGMSNLLGLYADELDNFGSIGQPQAFFHDNALLASNSTVSDWWNNTYNLIYAANAVVEGVDNSGSLSLELKNQLKGEGLFIRSYLHLLLVELYGNIPYITTTDYLENTTVVRMPKDEVYEKIISDLILAVSLLPEDDISDERVIPYSAVADALLARVYLYAEQWTEAAITANKVINQTGVYEWEPDLGNVFLKNALGTLWQFKPTSEGSNSLEAFTFIFISGPPPGSAISNTLLTVFEPGDQRRSIWVGEVTDGTDSWYHPFKYKETGTSGSSVEYSVIFRLAEQYLIRAEARAHLGNINGAQEDLNTIRNRAGLGATPAATMNDLLDAIMQERRVELFTEQGHRWFDLKRTGRADNELAPIKLGWQATDVLLPIPESEILVNPNLLPQNPGY